MADEFMRDIPLNNGQTAKFIEVDFWSRPVYEVYHAGYFRRVCCTELNGTDLHTMTDDGEPLSRLKSELQPAPRGTT